MASWPVQEAKARFSELLDTTLREGPQIVTRRGKEEAVVVPIDEWRVAQNDHGEAEKRRKRLDLIENPKWRDSDENFDLMDMIPEFKGTLEGPDFSSPEYDER
ncbi:MAG: type II toxin-antitoxin system Phd/YefM family antitoxin [Bryobacteraceae bacterium]|nr:type II toxin-antitoxin system Phd/YefM family antitoxin [Bryobacteraceae bacterium]